MRQVQVRSALVIDPDPLPASWARALLALLLLLYLVVGGLYARHTPLWQVPDEPAHVNYARHVAATGTLPVLRPGDYDAAYLERIKAAHFPPDMSVASIRYESHQPPLYYLGAALLLRLLAPGSLHDTSTAALALAVYTMRGYSLFLGLGLLLATYALMRRLFPAHPSLALAAVAFIAFIPQHVAIMAGANNDALAETVLALLLWRLIMDGQENRMRWSRAAGRGALLGVVLLTKTTIYLPAALAWLAYHALRGRKDTRQHLGMIVVEGVLALLLASPFFVRNVVIYGWPDVLGLRRHAAVVVGQMTTAEFIAREGWAVFWLRAFTWTFQSFWGQFGWMGVLMDARVYRGLAYFSLILTIAVATTIVKARRHPAPAARGLAVLAAAAAGTIASYIGYNLSFLQHQGRYLFPMLIPLAAFVTPGLWGLLAPRQARWLAIAAFVATALSLVAAALDMGVFSRWDGMTLFLLGAWFALAWRAPRWRPLWVVGPFVTLAGLALFALYRFILPAL